VLLVDHHPRWRRGRECGGILYRYRTVPYRTVRYGAVPVCRWYLLYYPIRLSNKKDRITKVIRLSNKVIQSLLYCYICNNKCKPHQLRSQRPQLTFDTRQPLCEAALKSALLTFSSSPVIVPRFVADNTGLQCESRPQEIEMSK
jgi:hypothetical protein